MTMIISNTLVNFRWVRLLKKMSPFSLIPVLQNRGYLLINLVILQRILQQRI